MGRAVNNMPEMTTEEAEERRLAWQEWQWNWEEDRARPVAIQGWLDVPGMWSAASIAAYCTSVTAEQRHARAAQQQQHISRYNEYAEIAAEVYAATSDYELPY